MNNIAGDLRLKLEQLVDHYVTSGSKAPEVIAAMEKELRYMRRADDADPDPADEPTEIERAGQAAVQEVWRDGDVRIFRDEDAKVGTCKTTGTQQRRREHSREPSVRPRGRQRHPLHGMGLLRLRGEQRDYALVLPKAPADELSRAAGSWSTAMIAELLVCASLTAIDGDTVKCDGQNMRLLGEGVPFVSGIDTPEIGSHAKCINSAGTPGK